MTHHEGMQHQDLGFLNAWLKDAYGMEKALVPVLENHAKDAKEYPQIQMRIEQHLEATKRHADLVEQALNRLGDNPSSVKSAIGSLFGSAQSISTGAAQDEIVKNGLTDFATEHFEIASYRALITAAQALGETEIAQMCQSILRDEEEMAHWLEQSLPIAVNDALRKKQMDNR